MLLEIRHFTSYQYESPVFLEPQSLRLKPRSDAAQRLVNFRLDMDPAPAGWSENVDLEGNDVLVAWFDGTTSHLTIGTSAVVETLRLNPFQFIWIGDGSLPVAYAEELAGVLAPYRRRAESEPVMALAERLMVECDRDANAFPMLLAQQLHAMLGRVERPEGEPLPPEETLRLGEGSCRDQTLLFMETCRALGYAARFVSGYYYAGAETDEHELHAWAEVYLPGGGWRGFDPTSGLAAGEAHIAIAAAIEPRMASPLSGTIRGRGSSSLQTHVELQQVSEDAAMERGA